MREECPVAIPGGVRVVDARVMWGGPSVDGVFRDYLPLGPATYGAPGSHFLIGAFIVEMFDGLVVPGAPVGVAGACAKVQWFGLLYCFGWVV